MSICKDVDLIGSREAARILGVAQTSVSRMRQLGQLPAAGRRGDSLRGAVLYDRAEVQRVAAERRAALEKRLKRMGTDVT